MKRNPVVMGVMLAALAVAGNLAADECRGKVREGVAQDKAERKAQITCPVMGGAVNRKLFADVQGHRIYVCCAGCIEAVRADPAKALAAIRANGETAEALTPACCRTAEETNADRDTCRKKRNRGCADAGAPERGGCRAGHGV